MSFDYFMIIVVILFFFFFCFIWYTYEKHLKYTSILYTAAGTAIKTTLSAHHHDIDGHKKKC